jgi:hypothetical protein
VHTRPFIKGNLYIKFEVRAAAVLVYICELCCVLLCVVNSRRSLVVFLLCACWSNI